MEQPQSGLAAVMEENLPAFQAFARRRLDNDALAADVVQEALLRALRAEPRLSHKENLLAWCYRILRNVLTDFQRRQGARERAMEKLASTAASVETEDQGDRVACACLHKILPALRPEYGDILRRVDLEEGQPGTVARDLGISRSNLNVRLHRARRRLREELLQTCGQCATGGCVDCTCNPSFLHS